MCYAAELHRIGLIVSGALYDAVKHVESAELPPSPHGFRTDSGSDACCIRCFALKLWHCVRVAGHVFVVNPT